MSSIPSRSPARMPSARGPAQQPSLFDDDEAPVPDPALPAGLPEGLDHEAKFLTAAEEAHLVRVIATLPLEAARYKEYTARRRVASYGGAFDYDANRLRPAEPLPLALHALRDRVAAWAGLAPDALAHALVAEYAPGTPLGWHRDVPEFEEVIGVSLGAPAVLRFRPWPPVDPKKADVVRLVVAPRSLYRLRGAARWGWQHSVAPVEALRWSITFRTPRMRGTAGSPDA
jgi:alkylated DNA repair dioxygenase AlkB